MQIFANFCYVSIKFAERTDFYAKKAENKKATPGGAAFLLGESGGAGEGASPKAGMAELTEASLKLGVWTIILARLTSRERCSLNSTLL